MDILLKRRSIRKYKDEKISSETIKKIINAGFYAPSAGNEQAWQFVVIDDEKIKTELAGLCQYWGPIAAAKQIIIVVGDTALEKFPGNWPSDCAAATQNILLEIESLGLGGVWMGIYPEAERISKVKTIINAATDKLIPFSIIAFGVPDEHREVKDRYDETRVHHNTMK